MINIKKNKIFALVILVIFLQIFHVNLQADDTTNIDEEELPAQDPFAGGTTGFTSDSTGESNQTSSYGNNINGIRVIGTAMGERSNYYALILTPDGLTKVYGENEVIFGDIQLLDIGVGWITVRLNSEENFDISIDGQIVPQEGN